MNAKRNMTKHRVGWSLALIALVYLSVGCGPVLPNAPALDAADGGRFSRSAGADTQIGDGEDSDGGGTTWSGGGTTASPYSPGSRSGQGGKTKKPKKH